MLSDGKITDFFCLADDFCNFFKGTVKHSRHHVYQGVPEVEEFVKKVRK